MLLCVDEPSSGAYYGSVVAKPYAKEIFERIIEYKNIDKQSEVVVENIEVPNLIGLSLSQAVSKLEQLGVYYEVAGEGSKIIWQFPSATKEVKKDTTILINTD